MLYCVSYKLTGTGEEYVYYYSHNWRGDIVGLYNGNGELRAKYTYDAWGNVTSITDQNGNAITSKTHVGNLNPFRYRGYYQDTETGFYYLMSRYYDTVTHRFVNADGYFQTGSNILDVNMNIYCGNNPIMNMDPTGLCYVSVDVRTPAGSYLYTTKKWKVTFAIPGAPNYCNNCHTCRPGTSSASRSSSPTPSTSVYISNTSEGNKVYITSNKKF